MMSKLVLALNWYQKKIGAYDKQSWEKTVDQRILRGVCAVPKKTARIKTELIDVDLVRGSAFPKAKPQHSWIAATFSGVIRVAFLPVYFKWWRTQTSTLVTTVFVVLYFLQITAMYLYFSTNDSEFPDVPASEIVMPAAMMLILGIVHSQIVATFSSKSSHKQVTRTKRKRVKRKLRIKTSLDYETKSSPETASEDKTCNQDNHTSTKSENCDKCIKSHNNHQSYCPAAAKYKCQASEKQKNSDSSFQSCECKCDCSSCTSLKNERKKSNSDDESGLDDLDFVQRTDEVTSEYFKLNKQCKVHHDSGFHDNPNENSLNANDVCSCGKPSSSVNVDHQTRSLKFDAKNVSSNIFKTEKDAGNASSGEEYFVAKKPSYSPEQWKHYLLEMKNNTNVQKRRNVKDCKRANNLHVLRRYSDVGPSCKSEDSHQLFLSNFERGYSDGVITNLNNPELTSKLNENVFFSKSGKDVYVYHGNYHDLFTNTKHKNTVLTPLQLPVNIRKPCSSCESGAETTSPNTPTRPQTSDLEWPLITNTDCNSDSSDCSSQSSHGDETDITPSENPFAWEMQEALPSSFSVGYPGSDKGSRLGTVSCTIWEHNECKKVDLTVLDISSAIIKKVDSSLHSTEYLTMGLLLATIVSVLPLLFRLQNGTTIDTIQDVTLDVIHWTIPSTEDIFRILQDLLEVTIGTNWRIRIVVIIVMLERFMLSLSYFFLLSVAEKTFKQRFLYAKHFCHLTSSRRARRSDLPHFRLNKVRNIKTWLSVRSYLKKLGPQRSVDVIVSIAFILEVCILSFLCVQLLKESGQFASKLPCWENLYWTLALGFYLLRFMIIGSKINKKYRNLSVLITEQINLYLHMEQKPHKKEELMLANNVLKLAADLLKELESPFKISGLCANPYLYNITKVVVLSAFSAVLTEVLGFKLKLYKIKIK